MRTVTIADMTLRTNNKAGVMLGFKEKVEIAKRLSNLNVDVIELPALSNIPADTLLLRTISAFANNSTLSLAVGDTADSVKDAANALAKANSSRLSVQLPVSPVQMEYIAKVKPPKMLEKIKELVTAAKSYIEDVEFNAIDATRAEKSFLINAIETAVECGATIITLCDTAAAMLPDEYAGFIAELKNTIPALNNVKIGVECSNGTDMAVATTVFSLRENVDELKVLSSSNAYANIVPVAHFIEESGERYDVKSNLKMTELIRQTDQIKWITKSNTKDTSFEETSNKKDLSGINLGKNEDIAAVTKVIESLGYDLSDEDITKVYDRFCNIMKKKTDLMSAKELDMIISSEALQVPPTYILKDFIINCGNNTSSSAHIMLEKDGEMMEGVSLGDGPIDAAFLAIEQIIGRHYELDDFQIQSVTEGRNAMGSALVRLRSNGKLYSGNGISTDIIGASIRAYMNAINKIAYEEVN